MHVEESKILLYHVFLLLTTFMIDWFVKFDVKPIFCASTSVFKDISPFIYYFKVSFFQRKMEKGFSSILSVSSRLRKFFICLET